MGLEFDYEVRLEFENQKQLNVFAQVISWFGVTETRQDSDEVYGIILKALKRKGINMNDIDPWEER